MPQTGDTQSEPNFRHNAEEICAARNLTNIYNNVKMNPFEIFHKNHKMFIYMTNIVSNISSQLSLLVLSIYLKYLDNYTMLYQLPTDPSVVNFISNQFV